MVKMAEIVVLLDGNGSLWFAYWSTDALFSHEWWGGIILDKTTKFTENNKLKWY